MFLYCDAILLVEEHIGFFAEHLDEIVDTHSIKFMATAAVVFRIRYVLTAVSDTTVVEYRVQIKATRQ